MRKMLMFLRAVNQEYRLLTEDFYNFYMDKVKEGRDEKFTKNIETLCIRAWFIGVNNTSTTR